MRLTIQFVHVDSFTNHTRTPSALLFFRSSIKIHSKSQSFHPPSPLAPGKSAEQASCLSLTAQLASEMFKRSKKSNLKHVLTCIRILTCNTMSEKTTCLNDNSNYAKSQATACHNKPRSHVLVSSKFKVPSPLASQVPHSVAKTATDSTALVTLSRSSSRRNVMHLILDAIILEIQICKYLYFNFK